MSNNEILREFLLETHENLALLDSDLVKLESNPTEKNTLAQVFRTFHSVKGAAGFMGLVKLQAIAHAAESLLTRLRSGEILLNPSIATALLQVVDSIREIISNIEASGGEGAGDYTTVTAEVNRLREAGGIATSAPPTSGTAPVSQATIEIPPPIRLSEFAHDEPPPTESAALTANAATIPEATEGRANSVVDAAVRVDVDLLDKLMTLVGELVLARNQILQRSIVDEDNRFLGAVQRLNLLTTELQASVMKTRMQPVGNVMNKFPRVVRDLSLACGKKVRFEMDGQETELDRTLIEAIRDPLTHMIRNAVDHGIEAPDVRRALGKSEEGRLRMVAFHEGGKVIVEITDDGAGIDESRVREKALSAKLLSPAAIARMSRQELLQLVFLPGFSTADQVTQYSGRGVGMDVVRTNIERIGGTVEIESTAGQGTTIRTKIPLTLAIIPALIVTSGGERYAIPQISLLELVRLDAEHAPRGVERIHDAPVYRLRGALLPLVFLDEQLQLETARTSNDELNIVVLQVDDRPFGLVVDSIRDTEEIVVKPLQKQLKGTSVYAGATIMGDGRVALVLDVMGLAQRAKVKSVAKDRAAAKDEGSQPAVIESQPVLLFAPRDGGQMAIPLSLVARLEEFPRDLVERLGARQVVQYRGDLLPLIDVALEMNHLSRREQESVVISPSDGYPGAVSQSNPSGDMIPVVVCSDGNERVGLIVGKVLDIVNEPITSRSRANRRGALFASVIQGKATEHIDVATIIRGARREESLAAE